ncbi:MAG: PAS domain S-box protein, partial [Deltaproteobacteria bacterium]|nr:PAS domain S-box protein [Deltaproteobacteria bacterium]
MKPFAALDIELDKAPVMGNRPTIKFPWRIFLRALFVQAAILLVALTCSGLAARYFFKRQFLDQTKAQLQDTLVALSRFIPQRVVHEWCTENAKGTSYRLTIIRNDGGVICDSHHDSSTMDNHSQRPEIVQARSKGIGSSVRRSTTLEEAMLYGAMHLASEKIFLRVAIPLPHLTRTIQVFDVSLLMFLGLLAAVLSLFAIWSARLLVFPLGRLLIKTQNVLSPEVSHHDDFNRDTFGEWSDLESNIEHIRKNLQAKTEHLTREQSELETIMSAISDAIYAVDPNGNPLFFNSRFELLFLGKSDRKNLKLWEVFREPEILGAFEVALKEEKTGQASATPLEQREGLKRFFSLSVSPLRKHDGHLYGVVGIFHDVTDLKSAEQMRIDFVANVTHELRTPLTSIKGYSDTLVQDIEKGKPPSLEFLSTIKRNSDRLMNLINDLLDLSSLESIDILQRETVNTEEVTARALSQLSQSFESKRQQVEMKIVQKTVLADAQKLEQVLVNLLDNANKYTPTGGKICVLWESDDTNVFLKISDTGPGIPIEHQSRLFERFYRVDKARSRAHGGTGLGLAIVKHIIQRHQGTVWVQSEPEHGAT